MKRLKGDSGVKPEWMVNKRVSKLIGYTKSSSTFHSSLNCGIAVINAARYDLQDLAVLFWLTKCFKLTLM